MTENLMCNCEGFARDTATTNEYHVTIGGCPYCDPPRCPHCGRILTVRPCDQWIIPRYPYYPQPNYPWWPYYGTGDVWKYTPGPTSTDTITLTS